MTRLSPVVTLGALSAAKDELAKAVAHLKPIHRFQIIAYNQQCVYLQDEQTLLKATESNKASIQDFFTTLPALGSTQGGVAFWAHIGGFVAGSALIYVFRDNRMLARHPHYGWRKRSNDPYWRRIDRR